jgi:hypothetical protein
MSSLTGIKMVFLIAVLAAGFAVASLAITTPSAFAQNATNATGNATMPAGNQTGTNATMPAGNQTK